MAVVLLEYRWAVVTSTGRVYVARACGAPADDGTRRWHGWLEFMSAGDRAPLCTQRETTQPNRAATLYWAAGITPVYLEGALQRATRLACTSGHLQPRLGRTAFDRWLLQWLRIEENRIESARRSRSIPSYAPAIGRLARGSSHRAGRS
jgi:hypothetical protein